MMSRLTRYLAQGVCVCARARVCVCVCVCVGGAGIQNLLLNVLDSGAWETARRKSRRGR